MLEIVYLANTIATSEEKTKLLYTAIAKIKVIDFLLNLAMDRNFLVKKKYLKIASKIDDIAKFVSGWMKSLNKVGV